MLQPVTTSSQAVSKSWLMIVTSLLYWTVTTVRSQAFWRVLKYNTERKSHNILTLFRERTRSYLRYLYLLPVAVNFSLPLLQLFHLCSSIITLIHRSDRWMWSRKQLLRTASLTADQSCMRVLACVCFMCVVCVVCAGDLTSCPITEVQSEETLNPQRRFHSAHVLKLFFKGIIHWKIYYEYQKGNVSILLCFSFCHDYW